MMVAGSVRKISRGRRKALSKDMSKATHIPVQKSFISTPGNSQAVSMTARVSIKVFTRNFILIELYFCFARIAKIDKCIEQM